MAKEWYLLSSSTKPNSIGGYENEGFQEYKDDAFSESLDTDLATTVILYNSDLSESRKVRCIIQGNTPDTQLKTMERIGLFQCGTVKAGMYILYENRYWLIDGYPGTQGIYEKATMCLCQYHLRWQNGNGDIIERWCNLTSASKYDIGESGNSTIILTSNNYTIKMPYDKETIELEGKRVFIDKKPTSPTKVFKLTRNDDVLYDYGDEYHGSILSFIADKNELIPNTDNQELRICDYNSSTPTTPTTPSSQEIVTYISDGDTLRIGRKKSWIVSFTDEDENEVEYTDFTWNIQANFEVTQNVTDTTIQLFVDDDSLADESFLLQILNKEGTVLAEKEITIEEGF